MNRLRVDGLKCITSGSCEAVSDELFEVAEDGTLRLLQPNVPEHLLGLAEQAVRECPARALTLARGTLPA